MKTLRYSLLMLATLLATICVAQSQHHFAKKDSTRSFVRLLFAGDAMQHTTQYLWAWDKASRQYNYEQNFRYLRPYLKDADISVVNFETTLAGKPYGGYPQFSTPETYFEEMLDAGFQIFTLANNHVVDRGPKGMKRTLKKMNPAPCLGAYLSPKQREEQYPLIMHIDGMKIALFNATYGTNQLLPVAPHNVNYIETEQLEIDLAKSLKDTTIDLRVMYIHWGTEYQLHHNAYQQGVGQWLADLGIDLLDVDLVALTNAVLLATSRNNSVHMVPPNIYSPGLGVRLLRTLTNQPRAACLPMIPAFAPPVNVFIHFFPVKS
jgi:poly-gamma-glutamate synthesis protein (capsule biosynthesis protein)